MVKMKDLLKNRYEQKLMEIAEETDIRKKELFELESNLRVARQTIANSQKYGIELKYDGIRALVHKGSEVKIYSDQATDITSVFQTIANQTMGLDDKDFILDCEIVLYDGQGNPQEKEAALKFLECKGEGNDSIAVCYAFDCIFFEGQDITKKPWNERRKILNSFKFSDNVKESAMLVAKSKPDAEKAIKIFSKLKGSDGVVIKRYDGAYELAKETDAWIKIENGNDLVKK